MKNSALNEITQHVQSATGHTIRWQRAFDTISNSAWLVEFDGKQGVLRRHTLSFGAPVTDHTRELAIHRLAIDAGLSPDILYVDTEAGLLISRYEPAGVFGKDDIYADDSLSAIAATLRQLHAIELPAGLDGYSLSDAAECYWRRAGCPDDQSLTQLVSLVREHESRIVTPPVLCHRDLLHSNILNTRPVQLIDWEFASPGEGWFDLAAFVVWHEFDEKTTDQFIGAYLQREATNDEQRAFKRAVESFAALCTLWSLPAVA
ncbi:MAG: phosphotransferase [Woeseiaceae bacterium]